MVVVGRERLWIVVDTEKTGAGGKGEVCNM